MKCIRRTAQFLMVSSLTLSAAISARATPQADEPTQSSGQVQTTPGTYPSSGARILFTGKLMGYYRLPDQQSINFVPTGPTNSGYCLPPTAETQEDAGAPSATVAPSPDARVFIGAFKDSDRTLLVGTGDNFGPNYYSRILTDMTAGEHAANPEKELYDWDNGAWTFYAQTDDVVTTDQRKGWGTIPTDNVACFMSYVHYDAIVPGKEDFYYGPERLRELARLLATPHRADDPFQSVQMLASNMVIKTFLGRRPYSRSRQWKAIAAFCIQIHREGQRPQP